MHSPSHNHSTSVCDVLFSRIKVGNNQHLTVVTSQSLTHGGLPYTIAVVGMAHTGNEFLQIAQCVRVTMSNIHLVMIIPKRQLEAENIVETGTLLLAHLRILVVADILTISMPSYIATLSFLS